MATKAVAAVRTDLTDTLYRGYVRQEEDLPEDSPQYQAGCGVENRKRPPPDEVPGDAFDRQRVICGFDHGLVERQVCLVLGTGGVGQDVALTLARLGVGRIILVDRDVYDASNLTRQCLGGKKDVGRPKVEVAAEGLREHHSIRSEVEAYHIDAVLEWPTIISLARRATVVFNAIDAGVMWDFCVNSLCKELQLPLSCGQSFAWKFMTEFYTGAPGECCAFCYDSTLSSFSATLSAVKQKGGVLQRLRSYLAANSNSIDAGPESLAAFLAQDPQFRSSDGAVVPGGEGSIVCAALSRAGLSSVRVVEVDEDAAAQQLLAFLQGLNAEVVNRLLPGNISSLPDVAFIPRPVIAATRYFGSWVCPCLGCAATMVSQWSCWLTSVPTPETQELLAEAEGEAGKEVAKVARRPPLRNPPQTITFNLDAGMTGEEQLGYELGALGVAPDRAERRFCREAPNGTCQVCSRSAALSAEQALFMGRLPVILAPVPGEVVQLPASWLDPPGEACPERRASAASVALARRDPLGHLGPDYAQVVVPAMPALDWQRGEPGSGSWPPDLATMPLLKVPLNSEAAGAPSALQGVASGVRSAMVRCRGRWWRLKGCGNRDQGFPVEAKGDKGELNVRGCCFQHTADTELRMSTLVAEALAGVEMDCANVPAGSYLYAAETSWPLPKVDRYCCLFETIGNMRLGDHLIAGLMRLLPFLLPASGSGVAALGAAVAAGRGAGASEGAAPMEDLLPTAMAVSCGMPAADVAAQLRTTLRGAAIEEVVPPSSGELLDGTSDPLFPSDVAGIWDSACDSLGSCLESAKASTGEPSLLLWLAWRLGWEAGAAVRALHSAGIAWGTYPDAMGIHCNAHVNNLVVKPPGIGFNTSFLAPLDFDMAFTREGFLPEACSASAGFGLDTWEGLLQFEATMGMKLVLAGDDFASTGVSNGVPVPPSHLAAEIAVRDTLVVAYEASLAGAADAHPHQASLREAAYSLIKIALCLTTHVES